MRRIYLDHNASTPLDPLVLQAMIQELEEGTGNPSSIHFEGQRSRRRLELSRQTIASFLGVRSNEILFTSGGTEGANTLLKGVFKDVFKGHIISSDVEHSCVYQTVQELEQKGCDISFLKAGAWGAVTIESVKQAIRPDTRLITLMAANNETGVKTDIESIALLASQFRIPFIVDGVALLGKEPFKIPAGVSAMFFSGHKFHAPKGTGFIFLRSNTKLSSLVVGGPQESGRRAGTENLPGIIGLAKAIQLLNGQQEQFALHMQSMRDQLEQSLLTHFPDLVVVNGEGPRVVNISNLSFLGIEGEALLMNLDLEGLSVSHGSACSSGAIEPSRILLKMGLPMARAQSAIRFSVSRNTTQEEIEESIRILIKVVQRLRSFK